MITDNTQYINLKIIWVIPNITFSFIIRLIKLAKLDDKHQLKQFSQMLNKHLIKKLLLIYNRIYSYLFRDSDVSFSTSIVMKDEKSKLHKYNRINTIEKKKTNPSKTNFFFGLILCI